MRVQLPVVARHRHRRDRQVRNIVFALDWTIAAQRLGIPYQSVEVIVTDAQEHQVEILSQQPCDLVSQQGLVPFASSVSLFSAIR